ncbi:MAG: hypothetical protein Q8Q29_03695 [Actinomycetota bacterium]|nr:hypothetical protein [Actinomycetota bacterium]
MRELYRHSFDLEELARNHPPRFTNPNKQAFHNKVAVGAPIAGSIEVARWAATDVPIRRSSHRPRLTIRPGYFTYDSPDTATTRHWHLNFANYDLFSAYAGSLLAQDEMQVLEHPDLASVRIALLAKRESALVTDGDEPTPILVSGVPRRGIIDTGPAPTRPGGLYGNRFARASLAQIEEATTKLDPPTISNILAIEAPAYGRGLYTTDDVTSILRTAVTGFGAAVAETQRVDEDAETVIHTGWWGCGAYGGNQELMALLQLLAAESAGVDEVVFHTGTDGEATLASAREVIAGLPEDIATEDVVDTILARGYKWGVSDGN